MIAGFLLIEMIKATVALQNDTYIKMLLDNLT